MAGPAGSPRPTLSGERPPASISRIPPGAPSASFQSNSRPEPGSGESMRITSAGPLAAALSAGSPAAKAWITNLTRCRTHRTSESGSRPWSWAPVRPMWWMVSTSRSGRSSRKTPDGHGLGRQPLDDVADRVGPDEPAAARRHHESERVGAHGDREEGVLLARDPADLHEHAPDGTGRHAPRPTIPSGDHHPPRSGCDQPSIRRSWRKSS